MIRVSTAFGSRVIFSRAAQEFHPPPRHGLPEDSSRQCRCRLLHRAWSANSFRDILKTGFRQIADRVAHRGDSPRARLDFAKPGQRDVGEPVLLHGTVERDAILPKRTAADNTGSAIRHCDPDLLYKGLVVDAGRKDGPDVAAELRDLAQAWPVPGYGNFRTFEPTSRQILVPPSMSAENLVA